jgi:hypothetical protein
MNLQEIKDAIEAGKKVYWSNKGYEVVKGKYEYLIIWNRGGRDENCIGLTHRDGITVNGKENEFFIDNGDET